MKTYEVWIEFRGMRECRDFKSLEEVADYIARIEPSKHFKILKIIEVQPIDTLTKQYVDNLVADAKKRNREHEEFIKGEGGI